MEAELFDREKAKADPAEYFNKWAKDGKYDKDMDKHYAGPTIMAEVLQRHLVDKENSTILDVGAGTGLVGRYLQEHGFKFLDAMDPSSEMLEAAKKFNVYRKYYVEPVESIDNSTIQDGTYEHMVTCGCMRYIPSVGMHFFRRVVKPGGFVVILMEEYLLWEEDINGDHHDAVMKTMEKEGLWQLVEKTYIDNYVFGIQGVLVVFKVLKPCGTLTQAKQAAA